MTAFEAAYRRTVPWPPDPRDPNPQEDPTWRARADQAGVKDGTEYAELPGELCPSPTL